MRKSSFAILGAVMAAAILAAPSDASASIGGIVSIPGYVCTSYTATSRAYCPYFSQASSYTGSSVGSIYVDAYLYTSSAIQAKACEESYSSGAFYCGNYGHTSGSNTNVDMLVPGFSSISGAPQYAWDYYIVYMDNYTGGTFDVLGVGYL